MRDGSGAAHVSLSALVVDDDPDSRRVLAALVKEESFVPATAGSLAEARRLLELEPPAVVLVDLVLPDGSGLELLRDLEESGSETQIVLVTGHASVETAVEALRSGVTDYLTKPIDVLRLKSVLVNVARARDLKAQVGELREELRGLGRFGPLVGGSPRMQEVYDLIAKVAPTTATVLITGESGTGKELVARTIHQLSRRSDRMFLALNSGAVSPYLIESELFGHERGSFTGAQRTHRGTFEMADGGTLLLDEISEMPLALQVKLLRVLEAGEVTRVGGSQRIPVDIRVLAASNRDLDDAVAKGTFRSDLLYRLKVFPIELPPLRERIDDVLPLADHFLEGLNDQAQNAKRLTPAARAALRGHTWPGNVRELHNVLRRAFIVTGGEEIGAEAFPRDVTGFEIGASSMLQIAPGTSLADTERRLILSSLAYFGGNKRQAAEALGISLKTLYNRLNDYAVADPDEEEEEGAAPPTLGPAPRTRRF